MTPVHPLSPTDQPPDSSEEARVLSRAFVRASQLLGLSRSAQAKMLGSSEATLSRLVHEQRRIEPDSKEGELALLFLRAYRSLDALVGGDLDRARAWWTAENRALGGVPGEQVQEVVGLVHVLEYLDAMRGRL